MLAHILPVSSLLGSTFFMIAAGGLAGYLLPLRAVAEGWSTLAVSLIATSYSIAFTLSCVVTPRLVLRVGHIRVFAVLSALMSISLLMHALIVNPVAWALFRAIAGFSVAGAYMVIESWLNERVTNDTRGSVFSVYMVINFTAIMIGQFIVPLGDVMAPVLFMICAIGYAFALIPTGISTAQSPQPLTQVSLNPKAMFLRSPAAAIGSFLAGAILTAWLNLAPVYSGVEGLSTGQGAIMLAMAMIGGALFQIPLGRLSDKIDRRYVMAIAGLIGFTMCTVAAILGTASVTVFFVTIFLLGSVLFPIYSLNVAHANDHAEPNEFVEVASGLLIVYGFGSMSGPLIVGFAMDQIGPNGLFFSMAVMFAAYGGYAYWRTFRREMPDEESREDFQAIPFSRTQTPQTYELDPRVDQEATDGTS